MYGLLLIVFIGACKKENVQAEIVAEAPNFIGTFESHALVDENCANPEINGTRLATDGGYCSMEGDTENCTRELFIIEADSSFILRVIVTKTTPATRTGIPTDYAGTYSVSGRKLTACFASGGNCLVATINDDNSQLGIELLHEECTRTFLYERKL